MAGKKKEGPLKDVMVPFRVTGTQELILEAVAKMMHELEPLREKTPCRSEVINNLLTRGLISFEAEFGKIRIKNDSKRDKLKKN
jgi:hypothetical protein